jgi:hypothetical protein
MEPSQGAGEKRVSKPREEAGLSDRVHAFVPEAERLHEQNFDKAIDNEIAAWSVGERFVDDRVYRALEPSGSGIGGLDMDKNRQQAAEQAAVGGVQFEITAEHFEVDLEIRIAVPHLTDLTSQRLLCVEQNDFACEVAGSREGSAGWDEDEITSGEAQGFMAVDRQPTFAGQNDSKAGVCHSRTTHGPTAGSTDNLRADRARAQQGNHIGKRIHVPDDL